jgi:hypothetical protein
MKGHRSECPNVSYICKYIQRNFILKKLNNLFGISYSKDRKEVHGLVTAGPGEERLCHCGINE